QCAISRPLPRRPLLFRTPRATELSTLSLHDALPICDLIGQGMAGAIYTHWRWPAKARVTLKRDGSAVVETGTHELGAGTYTVMRSEEHTSELQSLAYLVCRLLLETKKKSGL